MGRKKLDLTEEQKARKREYCKMWRAQNKDKVLGYAKTYRLEHKDERAAYKAAYYQDNKEEKAAYNAAWYQERKSEISANYTEYLATKHGRAVKLVNNYNRRDKKRGFDISKNIDAAWVEENVFNGQVCYYCGESDFLKLGVDRINNKAPHIPSNCVPCCDRCNNKRSDSKSSIIFKAIRPHI